MPAASSLALALATMQLGALKGTHSTALLEMGQRLLQQQVHAHRHTHIHTCTHTHAHTHTHTQVQTELTLLSLQLTVFGESVEVKSGGVILPPQGLNNIYLPQLPLLAKTTMQIGTFLALF